MQIGLTAVVLLSVWLGPSPQSVRSEPSPEPGPAVAPAKPDGASTRARLSELATWVEKQGGQLSATLVDLETQSVLGEHNPALALNPASNMKLLPAAAALDILGPNYRFQTGLYGDFRATSARIKDLTLRGHGDPSLKLRHLWRLANALSSRGVRVVDTLWVDQSRFDGSFVPPAFAQQPKEWAAFRAPVSAVAIDGNTLTLNVLPQAAGAPARVWLTPPGAASLRGLIKTRKPGSGQSIQLSLTNNTAGLVANVGGHVAAGLPRLQFRKRLEDPRLVPGRALKALLEDLGTKVGQVKLGGAHVQGRITYHSSAPLSSLVVELGKKSDNF